MKNQTKTNNKTKMLFCILISVFCLLPCRAFAQTYWSGTKNYTTNTTIPYYTTIILTGNTDVNVAAGVTVTINGTIAGNSSYSFTKSGEGTLILTDANTYTGSTTVSDGKLQVGDGTNTTTSINSTSEINLSSASAVLRFEPGANMTFSKVISGSGQVEYNSATNKSLAFTGNNTYTGTTTIYGGRLYIGDETTTGAIAGNIINFGIVHFNRLNDYTYSGSISGTGTVLVHNNNAGSGLTRGTLTFTGTHTYTGNTSIYAGTLALTASASIVSSMIHFISSGYTTSSTLDISAGNKTVKGIVCVSGSTIILGTRTLTIDNTEDCVLFGTISGSGDVIKTGPGSLRLVSITNTGTTTGILIHNEGTVVLGSGMWGGDYFKAAATTLTVDGNFTIGGSLTLTGGNIDMAISYLTPHLTVSGSVIASGINTINLNINSPYTITDEYVLIEAASGITSLSPYVLECNYPDLHILDVNSPKKLVVKKFRPVNNLILLVLEGEVLDYKDYGIPQIFCYVTESLTFGGIIEPSNATKQTIVWSVVDTGGTGATFSGTNGNILNTTSADGRATLSATIVNGASPTTDFSIIFEVYTRKIPQTAPNAPTLASRTSTSITLNAVSGCEYLGGESSDFQSSPVFTGLQPNKSYIFVQRKSETEIYLPSPESNVAYFSTNPMPALGGTVAITGNTVFGQTLTAVASGLTSTPEIPSLGTLSYQWKRGTSNISGATASTYTLVQTDIGKTISVQITAANCTGSVTSTSTPAVTKAPQTTVPNPPTMANSTSTSITLTTVSGCEYNIGGGTFQSLPTFTGLTANTSYIFTQRIAETATHLPSPASTAATFSTMEGVGIVETHNCASLQVYPNPTTGTLTITNYESGIMNIEVFDIYGRKQKAESRKQNGEEVEEIVMDISNFAAGIYFLKVSNETIKIVKQ